ncbi:polyketide cyclase [Burkholderia singularis]|uniref:Polyketide cyclase n=2 Tax=Burkholderia singularis TaxID=1503053 RepID=A0A118DN18_9BURK|nr:MULTISPECIES: nuclear transport factor 2 family protein [Burkholderia]AOK32232.1 polyketide cyclase [Burkholderia sp. Bp7605]KVE25791.1 polyketide cyclase [Burkholderia singularis]
MTQMPRGLQPCVAPALEQWHAMIDKRDLSELATIVHPDAVFRSPMANSAYISAQALVLALNTVIKVFEEFTYHRQWATDDGLNVALEFSARVGDKNLKGVDLIRFDEHGKIVEFEVMVRPLSGLQALGAEMGARLGESLPAYKKKS